MIYLKQDDLKSAIFETLLTESSADFPASIDQIELEFIALIQSKLNGRYDVEAIFSGEGDWTNDNDFIVDGRHMLIVKVLKHLVIYELIRRNAARKIPSDIKDDYNWALNWLEMVKDNKENPTGLPPKTDADGNALEFIKWGNNKNEDYYL